MHRLEFLSHYYTLVVLYMMLDAICTKNQSVDDDDKLQLEGSNNAMQETNDRGLMHAWSHIFHTIISK